MTDHPTPDADEPQREEQRTRWWEYAADGLWLAVELTIEAGALIVRGVVTILAGIAGSCS